MRLTWAIAVVLALASAAWGATTWTAAADANYTNAGNWTNGVAGDGNTVDCSTATMPTANQLAAGTLNFNITNGIAPVYLEDFVNGASIGNVTVSHVGASVNGPEGAGITGSVTLTAGTFYLYGNVSETCSVAAGAELKIMGNTSITGALTSTGTIQFNGSYALSAPTFATCAGAITGCGTCSLDIESVITCTGALTITGPIDIMGGFNANGQAVTWTGLAAGDTLLCDVAGALNLGNAGGASTSALAVTASASTALGANLRCAALSATGGTFAGSTYTITCASFSLAGATFTGSGAMAIAGNLTRTSGTNSHTGVWALSGSPTVSWNAFGNPIALLTDGGTAIAITLGARCAVKNVSFAPGTTITGSHELTFNNHSGAIGALPNVLNCNFGTYQQAGAAQFGHVRVASGRTIILGNASSNNRPQTFSSLHGDSTFNIWHSFSGSGVTIGQITGSPSITLGLAASASYQGELTITNLGAVSSLARTGTNTSVLNALTLPSGARLTVTGTLTGTGIAVTAGNGARVKRGGGAATVTGVTATGWRLRTDCAIGAGNTNVGKLVTAGSPGGGP